MNLKAIIQKIASRFKAKAKTVETRIVVDTKAVEQSIADALQHIDVIREETMSTPAAVTEAAATSPYSRNTAVAIALALKSIDASLSVEAIQAATAAAIAAAYPAAAV
jgi:alpha-ketoglutarate-dependent taurine dioxygenase